MSIEFKLLGKTNICERAEFVLVEMTNGNGTYFVLKHCNEKNPEANGTKWYKKCFPPFMEEEFIQCHFATMHKSSMFRKKHHTVSRFVQLRDFRTSALEGEKPRSKCAVCFPCFRDSPARLQSHCSLSHEQRNVRILQVEKRPYFEALQEIPSCGTQHSVPKMMFYYNRRPPPHVVKTHQSSGQHVRACPLSPPPLLLCRLRPLLHLPRRRRRRGPDLAAERVALRTGLGAEKNYTV